jgi:hypothetical protein
MDTCYFGTPNARDQYERKLVSYSCPTYKIRLTILKVGHRRRNIEQDRRPNLKDKRSHQRNPRLDRRPPRHPILSHRRIRISIQNALTHPR